MELTGLDAALGLAEVQSRLVGAATGAEDPAGYFALFRNSELIGKDSHTWLRDTVVTSVDDHDLVRQGPAKSRLGADGRGPRAGARAILRSTCSRSGSRASTTAPSSGSTAAAGRRRPTGTSARRCSAASSGRSGRGAGTCSTRRAPLYVATAALLALRRAEPALRRGRQYLREISADGVGVRRCRRVRRPGAQRGGVVADPRPPRGAVRDQHRPGAGADGVGDGGRRAARGGGVAGVAVRQRRRPGGRRCRWRRATGARWRSPCRRRGWRCTRDGVVLCPDDQPG